MANLAELERKDEGDEDGSGCAPPPPPAAAADAAVAVAVDENSERDGLNEDDDGIGRGCSLESNPPLTWWWRGFWVDVVVAGPANVAAAAVVPFRTRLLELTPT